MGGITRRTGEIRVPSAPEFLVTEVDLVKRLRDADRDIPIVMISGIAREEAALAAGANAFLHYDEWLRIGLVVESLVHKESLPATEASDLV